jgi:thiol-disulfide isomerase/thioredoxin/outer membrane lipoprotein-sorting protein
MKIRLLTSTVLMIVAAISAFSQSSSSTLPADGLQLLRKVSQHYADAKSYHLEVILENTSHSDFSRNWEKFVLTAAEAPGGRYHYEGRSGTGSALRTADGTTVWTYHVDEHRYTQSPVASETSSQPRAIPMPEYALLEAEGLRKMLAAEGAHLKSATRLADTTIVMNGREIPCSVIRTLTTDQKRVRPDYTFEKTFWIDQTRMTIAKTVELAHTYFVSGTSRTPIEVDRTTIYSVAELDTVVPDDLFKFIAPADAKLVREFPDPMKSNGGPDLTGEDVPDLKLTSSGDKVLSLSSVRGKPVLLNLWATWCAPCVKGLADIAAIYKEGKDKGLVVLSIDQDEEAKTATDFLAKKSYTWPNFHDDGDISRSLGGSGGIPRILLINAKGKIVYDGIGSAEDELRTEIAKLGPEFASLAPKQQPSPCQAPK